MGSRNTFIEPWQIGKSTYTAATAAVVVDAAAAGDVLVLVPTASKGMAIHRIEVSGTATAATVLNCSIVARATFPTGGTQSALVSLPMQSTFPATANSVLAYTANNTPGSLTGTIAAKKLFVSTATTQPQICVFDFNVLTGYNPYIIPAGITTVAVNLGGVAIAGNSFAFTVVWSDV
jgi:hypothetical protein